MSSLITRETLVVSSLIFFVLTLLLSSLLSVTIFTTQMGQRSDIGQTFTPNLGDFFGFYVNLITFQITGVHPLVTILMWLPWASMIVAIISLIRG